MRMRLLIMAIGAPALAGCHTAPPPAAGGGASIFPPPVSRYSCADGTLLAVRLLGESASVQVGDQAAITLPQLSSSADLTSFSNGRQLLEIRRGQVFWGLGRSTPQPCTGG